MVSFLMKHLRERGNLLVPKIFIGADYTKRDFSNDAVAGLSVAAVLVPQSIAYALLAGLSPVHGLYAALFGGVGGSLWGASRTLATGPIAIVSLLTAAAVGPLALPGSSQYIALVAGLALAVGCIQILSGLFGFGFLVRLVPVSVLVGFSSAAAFVIILTQIPHLLGIAGSSETLAVGQLLHIVTNVSDSNLVTVLLSTVALGTLFTLRAIHAKLPGTIIVLVGGILATYVFNLEQYGVKLAGAIPSSLPGTDIPEVSVSQLLALSGHAFVIALVGFMSAYATVKEFSDRTRERTYPDRELVGQGFANIFSGLFRGYPVGGSLSRTAVNIEAGARTAWSGVYASVCILIVILFSSAIFSALPTAALAAVLVFAVLHLIDFGEMRRMYQITHTDGVISMVTFVAVFFLRLDHAILLGITLSLALYMTKVMWVHVVEVGFHPEWRSLVSTALFPNATIYPKMLMLRIDAPIFYANIERLELEIEGRLRESEAAGRGTPAILALDFSGVNHMDVTGVEGFADIVRGLHARHMKVFIITPRRGIREILERGDLGRHVRLVHGNRELRLIGEASLQGKSLV